MKEKNHLQGVGIGGGDKIETGFKGIQMCVAERRGYVQRNASLGDFVVRMCTYTNLGSTV